MVEEITYFVNNSKVLEIGSGKCLWAYLLKMNGVNIYPIDNYTTHCKKNNPKVELRETNDETPNLGYTLSNKKLLKTGFKFLYNLEESIKEMIHKWSKKKINQNLEFVRMLVSRWSLLMKKKTIFSLAFESYGNRQ